MFLSLNFQGFPETLLLGVNIDTLVTSWTKNQSVSLVEEAMCQRRIRAMGNLSCWQMSYWGCCHRNELNPHLVSLKQITFSSAAWKCKPRKNPAVLKPVKCPMYLNIYLFKILFKKSSNENCGFPFKIGAISSCARPVKLSQAIGLVYHGTQPANDFWCIGPKQNLNT